LTTELATPSTHPTKMRLYDLISGILLILPTIDFAVAMPVPAQEKRQPSVDMELIPTDTITMLEKRGDEFNLEELSRLILEDGQNPDLAHENPFARPKESSAAGPSSSLPPLKPLHGWTNVKKKLPSIPEDPVGEDEAMEEDEPGQSSPASSTMSDADPKSVGVHSLPNPGPSTESDHLLTGMDAPLSSPVYPAWFHPDHRLMGAHAPQPNVGPSNPRISTEFDSDHRLVAEEPSSGSGSSTESDSEMMDLPPSGQVSSTNPHPRSMFADSQLENLQAVGDPLKGNAKESRRISGTARGCSECGLEGVAQ
jgi:hypothetical protein